MLWDYVPAADGQMGTLMKLYREWQISGDDEVPAQRCGPLPSAPLAVTPGAAGTRTATA